MHEYEHCIKWAHAHFLQLSDEQIRNLSCPMLQLKPIRMNLTMVMLKHQKQEKQKKWNSTFWFSIYMSNVVEHQVPWGKLNAWLYSWKQKQNWKQLIGKSFTPSKKDFGNWKCLMSSCDICLFVRRLFRRFGNEPLVHAFVSLHHLHWCHIIYMFNHWGYSKKQNYKLIHEKARWKNIIPVCPSPFSKWWW